MAKGGKAKRAPARRKAKAPAKRRAAWPAKGKVAWWGPFTRYVHSVESNNAVAAKFMANRSAHISAHESANAVTFTAKQKNALISGSAIQVNRCIDAEASSPQPLSMHGGPVTHVGGGTSGGTGGTGSGTLGGPNPFSMHG